MKKLKLKVLDLGAHEVLTREQLKSVSGGVFGEWICTCPDGVIYTCFGGTEANCESKSSTECGAGNTASCQYSPSLTI
jgi:hypothetical protein